MLEMLSVYYKKKKNWLHSVASKGCERLHFKVHVRFISLIPFPETESADTLSVKTLTDALKRGTQTLNTKEWILCGKTFRKKALAEVGASLLHMAVCCQSFSRRSPRSSCNLLNGHISKALEWKAEGLRNLFSKAALQSREAVVL